MGLPLPLLCLVTDRSLCGLESLAGKVGEAVGGGVNLVQLREKDLSPGDLLPVASELRKATAGRALLFVNGPVEVALAAGADGVQLPEAGPPPAEVRRSGGTALLIGRSTHTPGAAADAASEGADLVQFGSVFATRSHPGAAPAGLEAVAEATRRCRVPVVGVGGIEAATAGRVVAAGAAGVAVISAILASREPAAAASGLWRAVAEAWAEARDGPVGGR